MATNYSPRIVTDGLILCLDAANPKSYPGTGTTWKDISGNGNDGTLTNGPTFDSANKGSIDFDGSNDYVRLFGTSTSGQFDFNSSSFTCIFWINLDSTVGCMPVVKRNNSYGWEFQISFNRLSWYMSSTSGTFSDTDDSAALDLNKWHNCCFVVDRDENIVKRYLDYQPTGTTNSIVGLGSLGDSSTDVGVGARYARSGQFVNGSISQVQMYNRALTESEITQNFNATRGRYGI